MKTPKTLNKITALTIAAGAIASSASVMADDIIKVYVDEQRLNFDVNPIIDNDRTLVPLRAIFEALGAEVEWNPETRTATASKGSDTVSITIDSNELYKNGSAVELDVPAKIVNDRTLVPVRAISESFDANVNWDAENHSVKITTALPQTSPSPSPAEAVSVTEKINFSESDIKALNEQAELIRYDFEQYFMPEYTFDNADTLYKDLEKAEDFKKIAENVWNKAAAGYALKTAINSETAYTIDADIQNESHIVSFFSDAIKSAQIDSDTYFEEVNVYQSTKGTRTGVITFKSANSLVQCKYLGVTISSDGKPRYFTAENDLLQPDVWFFCEVMKDSRGTLTVFDKNDSNTDVKSFVTLCSDTYEQE